MRSTTLVMVLGILIAIAPYSGFYSQWEDLAITVMGLLVFLVGVYVANKKRIFLWLYHLSEKTKIKSTKGKNSDSSEDASIDSQQSDKKPLSPKGDFDRIKEIKVVYGPEQEK